MPRLLSLLLVLALAAPAVAQTAPDSSAAPAVPALVAAPDTAAVPAPAVAGRGDGDGAEAGQALLTVGAQVAVVAGSILLNGAALNSASGTDDDVVPYLLMLTPAVAGGVACGTGRALGRPGSCRGALLWSFVGAAPGLAISVLGLALSEGGTWARLGYVLGGGLIYAIVPPFTALEGYRRGARVAPGVALAPAPDGGHTPVAALRVAF